MSVQVREVSRFDQVRFRGPGSLKIRQGDKDSLTIHAPAYLIDEIVSEVRETVLHLGYVSPKVHSLRVHQEIISYQLSMKDVRKIYVTGSGKVTVPDLDNDIVSVAVTGSGQLVMDNFTADRFYVDLAGSGSILVAGDVEVQSVNISAGGTYKAERLVSDFAEVMVSGSGSAAISVSDNLHVAISGSGNVSYAGYPELTKQITGSGKLTRSRPNKHQGIGEEYERR